MVDNVFLLNFTGFIHDKQDHKPLVHGGDADDFVFTRPYTCKSSRRSIINDCLPTFSIVVDKFPSLCYLMSILGCS